jgi:hypothetical protein
LTALPLLSLDNVTSATAGDLDRSTPVTSVPRADELAVRAQAWVDLRETMRVRDLEAATAESLDALAADVAATSTTTTAAPKTAVRSATTKAPTTKAPTTKAPTTTKPAPKATTTSTAPAKATVKPVPATRPPTVVSTSADDPTAEQWAGLRRCESGDNYRAAGGGGKFRGAYQFLQSTWNHVARMAYPHLDGIDPADASPHEQDAMALALFHIGGASQWPLCGSTLR